jgi:hypothetical protein
MRTIIRIIMRNINSIESGAAGNTDAHGGVIQTVTLHQRHVTRQHLPLVPRDTVPTGHKGEGVCAHAIALANDSCGERICMTVVLGQAQNAQVVPQHAIYWYVHANI